MPRKKSTDGAAAKPKPAAKKAPAPAPVQAVKHKDRRTNIPTREQGAMVADAEAAPKAILYPRDPSLDPQLVWKGKDEQDRHPLEVPAVPIYIQEKVHPQALIEEIRIRAAANRPPDVNLFADFNGLDADPAKRTDFYHHDHHWTNRLILGDSLLVMTSLAEKERLKGQVQCVYVDPPYGIKFGSNWQVSTRKRDVRDAKAEDLTRQPEQVKAFRDTWELGINSYLPTLRDRLTVARDLLTDSGSIFVQIGDENQHLVRCVMDEVFGSENFAGLIAFYKTGSQSSNELSSVVDHLLFYAKQRGMMKYRPLLRMKEAGERGAKQYTTLISPDMKSTRRMTAAEIEGREAIPAGWRICALGPTTSQGFQDGRSGPYIFEGEKFAPSHGRHWSLDPSPGMEMDRLAKLGRLRKAGEGLRSILLAEDNPTTELDNVWLDTGVGSFTDDQIYVVQTNIKVVQRCLLMTTDPGDLVLDPTCGSGTTAYVAEQWGRRWITIDTSRVCLTLARTRLMAARFPFYLPADSPEGRKKEAELTGTPFPAPADSPGPPDIRRGFVYKRVPHVTLKSIANNPDIKPKMTREQIDAAIRKHAETETLFDQPYDGKDVIRVSGPFTVESLSPHRVLPAGDGTTASAADAPTPPQSSSDFVTLILDSLRKAGVQNTKKDERLQFDRLDPYPGEFLQAEGVYTEGGKDRRAAVCIGPEFGTVGPELLADAAREAHRGIGFNLLLVCGFAFDPHVAEEGKVIEKQIGKLKVLLVRMNPDLAMGNALKKTGAGNLFMVFGEPDINVEKQKDGKLVFEVRGVDVFDPTTGEIRSSGPEDIACWFLDTDYNGDSFFVRHAYFLGGGDPYEKLKRALRAEVDEAEWSKLYSAKSIPFDPPKRGKVAVKVINHYGDEVLKVYPVAK